MNFNDFIPRERYNFIFKIFSDEEILGGESCIKTYFKVFSQETFNIYRIADQLTKFSDESIKRASNFEFKIIDSLKFDAKCSYGDIKNIKIELSAGVFLTLDDLMLRLMCNKDILSKSEDDSLYKGSQCAWLKFGNTYPKIRFLNYERQLKEDYIKFSNKLEELSGVFSAIPFNQERINLARFMSFVALTWIYIHEDTHYWAGHCHLLSEEGQNILSELYNNPNSISTWLYKAMEWEADREATRTIVSTFFKEYYYNYLPKYMHRDKKLWLIRVLILSICSVNLIFQKIHEIYKSAHYYPNTITRLTSAIYHSITTSVNLNSSMKIDIINEMPWIILHSLEEISVAAELLYQRDDLIDYGDSYNIDLNYKALQTFESRYELLEVTNAFPIFIYNAEKTKQFISQKIYNKYFQEYIDIANYHKQDGFYNYLYQYRKKASLGKTIYNE